MYKLSGHSLTRGRWFIPETQGMNLSERDSASTVSLGPDAPSISFGEWILDDAWSEGNYVWRVKNAGDEPFTETRTIELEHVIKCLDDIKIFHEITPAVITGSSGATTCTAKQAAEYLLSLQSDWELGDFEFSVTNSYEFNGESIYDGLETITETLENAVWEYDLSVYPFRLHIRQLQAGTACEMRGGRNLSTLRRTVSRSGMYTRIYPTGANNLHIDGEYLSANESLYGRIDNLATDQSKTTKEALQAWAAGLLRKHSEPTMTVNISGLELSADTGEELDRLKLNRVCRCPLPNSAAAISEKIVRLQWRDRRKEPDNVNVSLCNETADVSTILRQESRRSGKAAKGQAKQNYLFEANGQHLYYEIFDDCGHLHGALEMTSESLRIGFDNALESTRSEFLMTSESLRIAFENEIASTRSEFQMTSESLRIQFENDIASTRSEFQMTSESLIIRFEGEISSVIEQTATMIRMEVGSAVSGIYGSVIEQTATYIRTEVRDAASRIAQSVIEQTADYVHTEVSDIASGVAWSVVHQTMSGIFQEVARKATVYVQLTDPNDGINQLRDGDIWIFSAKRTWGELAEQSWNATAQRKWKDYYGALQYIWRDGKWVKIVDEPAVVEARTWVDQDSDHYAIMAEMLDTMGESYHSNLTVTAQKISADVSTAKSQIYSTIAQTATNINLHVEDKIRGVQSNIEQTADRITASVSAAKSTLWSLIEQTATGIMMQVNDDVNDLHSAIRQTSTNIHISVSTAKSTLYSAINVTATGIMQDVVDRDNDLRSAIVQTSTNIHLSVSAAKSTLYGAINITATGIMQDVVDRDNDLRSAIVQTSTNIHLSVSAAKSSLYGAINVTSTGIMQEVVNKENNLRSAIVASSTQISLRVEKGSVISSINQTAESITISAAKVNLSGYVKATDITANYISSILADSETISTEYLYSRRLECKYFEQDGYSCSVPDAINAIRLTQSGNTYTLQRKHFYSTDWENVGTFSRATTLTLAWDSSNHAVKASASPQENTEYYNIGTRFNSANGSYFIEAIHSEGSSVSSLSGTNVAYKLARSGTNVQITNASGTQIANTPQFTIPLQAKSATSNGTVTPDSGYVGLSSVTVNVPSGGGTIDIPSDQIYTTSGSPAGTKLTVLRNRFIEAQQDGDFVCFRVDCGDTSKWYYMEP